MHKLQPGDAPWQMATYFHDAQLDKIEMTYVTVDKSHVKLFTKCVIAQDLNVNGSIERWIRDADDDLDDMEKKGVRLCLK